MFELYYTGASEFLAEQSDPTISLGGFISCTLLPNDIVGNLFDTLSQSLISLNKYQTRVIAVKNDTGSDITGLNAYFILPIDSEGNPENEAEYQIGYQQPQVDSNTGDLKLENLASQFALPFMETSFQMANGVSQAIQLPDLSNQSYLGIYIRRRPTAETVAGFDTDTLQDIFDGDITLNKEEQISLVFDWN